MFLEDPENFRSRMDIEDDNIQAKEAREIAMRQKLEEKMSEQAVGKTSKPCPNCQRPIEKNGGW